MTLPLVVAVILTACSISASLAQEALVIRSATIIPLSQADSLPRHTVVIEAGTINQLGPDNSIVPPAGARVIDGTGKFIIPGLFEMHAHSSKTRASALGLYVYHGITTVRDLGSEHQEILRWRREIEAKERVGPRLVIAGPYLESESNIERMRADPPESRVEPFERARIGIASAEDAQRVIDELALTELDQFKIRTVENMDSYFAINRAADAYGIPVVGHAVSGPAQFLEAGQDGLEHTFYQTLDDLDREQRLAYWRQFAQRDIGVVPTLVTLRESGLASREYLRDLVNDSSASLHAMRPYLSRFLLLDWAEQAEEQSPGRITFMQGALRSSIRDIQEMREAGVRIMAGSDVAVINIFPGASLLDELELFVNDIGMTPLQALHSATRSPAEWLGLIDSVGTIEAGKAADLVILDADPLLDINNTREIFAVVTGGQYYDRAGLCALLETIDAMPDQTVNDWLR